jgi:hypothetical protein
VTTRRSKQQEQIGTSSHLIFDQNDESLSNYSSNQAFIIMFKSLRNRGLDRLINPCFLQPTCQLSPFRRRWQMTAASAAAGQAEAAVEMVVPPTFQQLRILALRTAIPMVGFGFMDNIVMIQAGDAIDCSIGVTFALSTLAAAGLGQCCSDVAGFTCGGIVDAAVSKLHLPHHKLSPAQLDLRISRMCATGGGCVGVVIGCLLGMTSLFFIDTDKADRAKKAKELKSIFETVMDEGHNLVNAERATLWMLDEDNENDIWSKAGELHEFVKIPRNKGIVGACIETNQIINIADAYQDERFNPDVDKMTGYHTRSVLVVPFVDDSNRVKGAIQMINKKNADGSYGVFDENDLKLVQMLGSHVTAFLRIVGQC